MTIVKDNDCDSAFVRTETTPVAMDTCEPQNKVLHAPSTRGGKSARSNHRGRGGGHGSKGQGHCVKLAFYKEISTGEVYKPGDAVYIDNSRPDHPFFVCEIEELKADKRNRTFVTAKWYFRAAEVPDSVYTHLVQDRHTENDSGRELVIQDPIIRARELFISSVSDTFPVSAIRGRCQVSHYADIFLAKDFQPLPDSFFYILGYNPETKRLATTQGEIRVGPSHQARLPTHQPNVRPEDVPECSEDLEDLVWVPSAVADNDLIMYLRAVRSMAAFVGMCDGGSTEDGCAAAAMDETTARAFQMLHLQNYDTGRALQALVQRINPKAIDKRWTDEEAKKFAKGVRTYGKNFFRVQKELLPSKETRDLVEFYYFWKKTPAAANNRPHRRHRRNNALRRQQRTPRPQSSEFLDLSSASEVSDNESEDSDGRELSGYACHHCFTTKSKDWHHARKDNALLCTECRVFFKKYGEDRPIDGRPEPPPFMFKPVRDEDEQKALRIRRLQKDNSSPDTLDSPLDHPKSPSAGSSCSTGSSGQLKRPADQSDAPHLKHKRPTERSDSPSEYTDSSSVYGNDENGHDGDIETNQDDLTSTASSSVPSPSDNDLDYKPPTSYLKELKPAAAPSEGQREEEGPSPAPVTPPPAQPTPPPPPPAPQEDDEEDDEDDDEDDEDDDSSSSSDSDSSDSSAAEDETTEHSGKAPGDAHVKADGDDAMASAATAAAAAEDAAAAATVAQLKKEVELEETPHVPAMRIKTEPLDEVASSDQAQPALPVAPQMHIKQEVKEAPSPPPPPPPPPPPLPPSTLDSTAPDMKPTLESLTPVTSALPPYMLPTGLPLSTPPPLVPAGMPILPPPPHMALPPMPPSDLHYALRPPSPPRPRPSSVEALPPALQDSKPVVPFTPPPPSRSSPLHAVVEPKRPDSRSRSRSPLARDSESEAESEGPPRSPSPPARIGNEECLRTKNAIFIRHWCRGRNSCTRSDVEFVPLPDSKLARRREERQRRLSTSSQQRSTPGIKEEQRKEDVKREDKRPSDVCSKSADAHVTSGVLPPSSIPHGVPPPGYPGDRLTPRTGPGYMGHDPTPALRQLSEYARPHIGAGHDLPNRSLPMSLSSRQAVMDPFYRMPVMYPPGSRERLEMELERDKRERDARERELREMEFREKMKQEMDLKPPGFDRLPPGANPLDPHWVELQRRYGPHHPGAAHLPGIYAHGNVEMLQRERERLERLGIPPTSVANLHPMEAALAERIHAERMSLDPMLRLQMAGGLPGAHAAAQAAAAAQQAHTHTHAHAHTHLHLHQPQDLLPPFHPMASMAPGFLPPHPGPHGLYPDMLSLASQQSQVLAQLYQRSLHEQLVMARHYTRPPAPPPQAAVGRPQQQQQQQPHPQSAAAVCLANRQFHAPRTDPITAAAGSAAAAAANSSSGDPRNQGLPPGVSSLIAAAREQEHMYRELLSRPPYSTDPVLAHQLTAQAAAQQEQFQRQIALERDRMGGGGGGGPPHHMPPGH